MVFCALAHVERCRRSMLRGFVFAGHAVQAWRLYASWYVSIASPRLLLKYVLESLVFILVLFIASKHSRDLVPPFGSSGSSQWSSKNCKSSSGYGRGWMRTSGVKEPIFKFHFGSIAKPVMFFSLSPEPSTYLCRLITVVFGRGGRTGRSFVFSVAQVFPRFTGWWTLHAPGSTLGGQTQTFFSGGPK